MKWSKIFTYFLAVITVWAFSYYLTTFVLNGKKTEDSSIAEQEKQNQSSNSMRANVKGTENELTKLNSNGAVAINTTLLIEKSDSNQLVFEVVMNTHSVDMLQYDLSRLSTISFGTNTTTNGRFEWEASNNDSHHMMGYLKWNGAVDKNYKTINLNLKNINNIPSRIFSWERSNKTDMVLNQ